MTLRTILIEDEARSRNLLRSMIAAYCPELEIVAEASDVAGGKKAVHEFKPEVLFMDVNLYGSSGFEILNEYQDKRCNVIFTTAYAEYAVQAFRYNTIDFLMKPIGPDDLKTAVSRLFERVAFSKEVERTSHPVQAKMTSDRIALPSLTGYTFCNLTDILYVEADGNYSMIVFKDQSRMLISKSLQHFMDLLDDRFMRVHKSFIVNMSSVVKYNKGRGGHVLLENNKILPVASRRKTEFLDRINKIENLQMD